MQTQVNLPRDASKVVSFNLESSKSCSPPSQAMFEYIIPGDSEKSDPDRKFVDLSLICKEVRNSMMDM